MDWSRQPWLFSVQSLQKNSVILCEINLNSWQRWRFPCSAQTDRCGIYWLVATNTELYPELAVRWQEHLTRSFCSVPVPEAYLNPTPCTAQSQINFCLWVEDTAHSFQFSARASICGQPQADHELISMVNRGPEAPRLVEKVQQQTYTPWIGIAGGGHFSQ